MVEWWFGSMVTLLFAYGSIIISNKVTKCMKVTVPLRSMFIDLRLKNHFPPSLLKLMPAEKKLTMTSTLRSYVIRTHLIMLDYHVMPLRNTNTWCLALSSILDMFFFFPRELRSYCYRMPGWCLYTQRNAGHIREICVVLNTALIGPHLDHLCPAVTHYSAMSWPRSPTTQDL